MENQKVNERIKGIVNNEVLTCQSMLVEELLQKEIVNYEDITNFYKDNSEKIEEKQNEIDEIQESERYQELDEKYMDDTLTDEEEKEHDEFEHKIEDLQGQIDELESEQDNPQEILEWWVVSYWLAEKLEEYGEPMLKADYETWWGRTCSGQSIELDYVIRQIAEDLENR